MRMFTAREARGMMPMTEIDSLLETINEAIKKAAKANNDSVIVTKLDDLDDWVAAHKADIPYTGPAGEIELDLRQRGFQVALFSSPDDGPGRPAWHGMEIRW